MEPTKESKTKAKKRRASKSSRKSSVVSAFSNAELPTRLGSEKVAMAVAPAQAPAGERSEERSSSRHSLSKSHQQSDQTHESGAVGSTDSSPASGQIASLLKTTTSSAGGAPVVKPCHLPSPPDTCDRSSTKRRGSRPAAEAAAVGASKAQQPPRKPSRQPEGNSTILQPLSQQQAELKTESPKYYGAKPSSGELVGTNPGAQPEAEPGETKPVDGHAQTRGEVLTVVQEVMHPETNPSANQEPTQDTKDGAKHDKAQAGQEQAAAPQGVQAQTDGSPLTGSHPGTSDVATQHTPAAAMAPPVVRHAATVDTGTDTPLGLWAGSGSIVPELPFASPEYKLPAKAATAKMAAAGARQPADKKRIESATNALSSVGRKSGPATTELGGIASTEATVMFDVNPYVRFPLLVMNLVLWLIGLTLVLVGAYAYVDTWTQSEVPTHKIYNVLSMFLIKMEITVMLFGMVTMSLSFCGCVGALRENTCLLNVYSTFITALLLINLVAGLMVFFLPSQIKRLLSETFSMELVVHYRDSSDFQRLMDNIQESMQCCGISRRNFRDWNANMYFNCSRANPSNERCSVPYSCCKRNSTDQVVSLSCGRNVLNMTDYDAWFQVYTGNCLDSAHRYVRDNVTIITGICLVFVILLAFVQMVTQALIDEILIIRRIYEKFYERAYDLRAAQEPTEPSAN